MVQHVDLSFRQGPIGPICSAVAHTSQLQDNLITFEFSGVITREEILELAGELSRIESVLPVTPHRLSDFSRVIDLPIGYDEINAFRLRRQAHTLRNPIRSAIYAPSDVQFGLSRMYQMLSSKPEIEVEIFRDRDEAMAWLQEADEADAAAAAEA